MLAQAGMVSTGKTDSERNVGLSCISRAKFGSTAACLKTKRADLSESMPNMISLLINHQRGGDLESTLCKLLHGTSSVKQ